MERQAIDPGNFTNGLDRILAVPANPLAATSGAWTSPDTFSIKIVLYETPFYSTMNFKFDGDRVVIDAEHNVSFGPTKLPHLVGQPQKAHKAQNHFLQ